MEHDHIAFVMTCNEFGMSCSTYEKFNFYFSDAAETIFGRQTFLIDPLNANIYKIFCVFAPRGAC